MSCAQAPVATSSFIMVTSIGRVLGGEPTTPAVDANPEDPVLSVRLLQVGATASPLMAPDRACALPRVFCTEAARTPVHTTIPVLPTLANTGYAGSTVERQASKDGPPSGMLGRTTDEFAPVSA